MADPKEVVTLPRTDATSDLLASSEKAVRAYDYAAALEQWKEAERLLDSEAVSGADVPQRLRIYMGRAVVQKYTGRWDEVVSDCKKAVDLLQNQPRAREGVQALLLTAEIHNYRGDYPDALQEAQEAYLAAELTEDPDSLAAAQGYLAALYSKVGDQAQAESRLAEAVDLLQGRTEVPEAQPVLASIWNLKGLFNFRQGRHDDAVEAFQKALQHTRSIPDSPERAEAFRSLGVQASLRLSHKEALNYHLEALEILDRIKYSFGKAKVYNSIGQTFLGMARLDEAAHFMEKAEKISTSLGALTEAATIYGKLGQVYLEKEDYDTAIRFFEQDLKMCEKFKNIRVLAYTHRNIGQSWTLKGESPEAILHFKESLNNFQYVGDEVNVGRIYVDLCLTYIQQSDLPKARKMAAWAKNIFLKTGQTYEAAYVTTLMGIIHRRSKEYDQAAAAFKDSIELLNFKVPTLRLADALYEYGLLFMDLGDPQKALGRFEAALKIAEGLGLKKQAMRYFRAIEEVDEVRLVRLLMAAD